MNKRFRNEKTIYVNERKQNGFLIEAKERETDIKFTVKELIRGKVSRTLFFNSLPKRKHYREYFQFLCRTVIANKHKLNSEDHWLFGQPIIKYLMNHKQ